MQNELTQARLKELFWYNSATGEFINLITRGGNGKEGAVAGTINNKGYRQIMIKGRHYKAHRLVFLYHYGSLPMDGTEVDHINNVKDDNRFSNLRLCTHQQNLMNQRKPSTNKSGHKGASFYKPTGKFVASIGINGTKKNLGYFNTAEEAHEAYCVAAKADFGEFYRAA